VLQKLSLLLELPSEQLGDDWVCWWYVAMSFKWLPATCLELFFIGHCLPCKVRSEVRIWGKLHCPHALRHAICVFHWTVSFFIGLHFILWRWCSPRTVCGGYARKAGYQRHYGFVCKFQTVLNCWASWMCGHQEPRNTRGRELVIPKIYRRPKLYSEITAAEMKYQRRTAGRICTDHKKGHVKMSKKETLINTSLKHKTTRT
jgi:hypothetical protein